jgi:TP901 family phage tail tape measure protein|nr:MAG TPA: minor tail protein [Caudoviricetes sp.]
MSADGHIEIEVELNSEKAEKELDSLSKSLEKDTAQAAKKAESSVKRSVKQIETSAKQASKQTESSAKQAGQEVKNTASSASKQVIDSAKKAEEEVKKSSKRVTEEEKKQYKEREKTRESSKPESDPSKPYKESSEKATQYWTGAGSKIKSIVSTITAATGAGAVAAGTAAINAGKSFEAGMGEVQAISGASRKDLEALTNKAKEMGATTKFSATQASEGLKYMAMAGWNSQQMIDGLPGVMNLAAASGEDLGTVSDIVTDALTAMGLKASDSAHFADVLATAASSSNTNVAMMGETFKYAAPLAGTLGYNIEDLSQAIGLMANAGIKGSQSGTSLRSILTRLASPPSDAAKAMEKYGISIKNSDGSMKSLMEVMENMRDSLQGLPEDEKAAAASALGGQEAMSGLLAIINASESDFDNLSKAIDNASGAAQDQADIMNDNLQGALYELGSAAESAGIELYDNIKNPAKKAVRAAATEIRSLSTTIKDNGIEAIIPEETITTVKNLGTTAKAVGAGGLKVLGGAAQFAGENIQTVLPVAASLLTVVKGYTVVKTISTAFAETQVAMAGASTGMTILGTVVKLFTGEALAATTATGLLSGAIGVLANPIALAVVAGGALTAGMVAYTLTQKKSTTEADKFAQSCKKLKKEQDEVASSIRSMHKDNAKNVNDVKTQGVQADNLLSKLKSLIGVQEKDAGTKQQIKSTVQQLNDILPDLNLQYDEQKDKLNQSTAAIKRNIQALKEQAMAKAYQSGMESAAEKVAEAEVANQNATEKYTEALEKKNAAQEKFDKLEKEKGLGSGNKELAKAAEDLMKYEKSLQTTEKALDKSEKNLNAANKELTTYSDKFTTQTNYSDFLSNLDKLAKDAGIKAKKIPETVLENIKAGNYKAPTTGEDLKRLINLDGLIQQAQEAGVEIPQYLLQGISDGSINFQSAINQMNTLLDFSSAAEKAGISGKEIPEELAQSIMQGKISVDEAINQLLSGSEEKMAKIKKNVEDIGNGKIKGINTSAYTSSLNTVSQKAKSTAKDTDKSNKEIKKNSKLKGTNNTAAAKQTYGAYKTEGEKAKNTVKKTGKEIGKGGATSAASTTSQWKSAGSKNAKSYISGVASQKGAAQKAGKTLSTSAKTGASSGKAGFVSAGRNMAAGIASGIHSGTPFVTAAARSAVRAAVKAAQKAGEIKSPSRVMKNEVGKYLPLGMAAGIKDNTDSVVNASRAMCASALTASADELDIHSPSRKFKNIIGKNIPKGIAKGVRESKSELVGEMESVVNEALSAAQNASKNGNYSEIGSNLLSGLSTSLSTSKSRSSETIQEIIDQQQESLSNANQKKEEALQSKIDKLGSKKANKKRKAALKKRLKQMKAADKKQESQLKTSGEKAAAAYNDAFEKEASRITKIAEKKIQELSETYQTKYNDIKNRMDTLTEKQQSWGNVYDLKQNIADIKRYQENLKALEGRIPESMMNKILGMNMDEATAYMDWFRGMTATEQKAYLNDWNAIYSSSETFSKNFFTDDFAKIQKEYESELKKATDNLYTEMNQIGANIAKGLTAGMDSESRNLSKAMKKICNNLINTAKKELKIKSPSRVFKRIGVYNIQGAEKGHEAEAPRLYRQVENVSETLAERFAKANLKVSLPDIAGRTQAALSRQVSKVSASIQPQLTAALAGDAGQTIYNGPEKIELVTNLDGREIARTSVPYIDAYLGNMAARKARGGV